MIYIKYIELFNHLIMFKQMTDKLNYLYYIGILETI